MRDAVEHMLDRYPDATLQDIYKSMFQDRFGVAHLLAERAMVRRYIEQEVALTEGKCSNYYESCGWRGNYKRVDLRAVRDGVLTLDELTDMFMRSAERGIEADSIALRNWQSEWLTISRVCRDIFLSLDGYVEDSTSLSNLISSGRYVVHHSKRYNDSYRPHYRIVHTSILNNKNGIR